jgi:hypothetical protein
MECEAKIGEEETKVEETRGGRNKKESLDKMETCGLRNIKEEATREEGTEGTGTGRKWLCSKKEKGTEQKGSGVWDQLGGLGTRCNVLGSYRTQGGTNTEVW